MNLDRESESAGPVQGQLLRLSERREVAIYLHRGRLWIADFVDGQGELIEPEIWFRFNCGSPETRHTRRRMLLESALPLSAGIVTKIENLHRATPDPNPADSKEETP
jgi:hypothetical protein